MMNLGATEMLLLGILALILFGPRRLPELGKALGEGLSAFRESSRQLSSEFRRQLEEETATPSAPKAIPADVLLPPEATPVGGPAPTQPVESFLSEEFQVTEEPIEAVFESDERKPMPVSRPTPPAQVTPAAPESESAHPPVQA